MRAALFVAFLILVAPVAHAATHQDVAKLAWLAGGWSETKDGVTTRETWLPPLDGAMAGAGQTTRAGRPAKIEFQAITTEPAGVTFTAYIQGEPATPFLLQPGPEGEAVFENPKLEFPRRVIYRRCGEDLCAAIEGMVGGKAKTVSWRYARVKP